MHLDSDLVALGVPLFAVAIAVESWLGRPRGRRLYHTATALSDVACGATYATLDVVLRVLTLAVYTWLLEHARLVTWDEGSPWPWVIGIVGVDFGYYAWHRLSHVVNAMWAVHVVHHHSEDYNFAVALRQPLLEPVSWIPFFAVLAIVGVPFEIYLLSFSGNLFYQFWLHTELVGRLPAPVEWVFNTPSHHRVHHGIEPEYLDRNYGGMLIVWDRLLGTFEPESRPPTYGTTKRLHTFNPLWANAAHWHHIGWLMRHATTWREWLWAPLAHPGWRPAGAPPPGGQSRAPGQPRYRPALSETERRRALGGFALALVGTGALVVVGGALPWREIAVVVATLVVAYVALVGRAEGRAWARRLEPVRVVGLGVAAVILAAGAGVELAGALAIGLGTSIAGALTAGGRP
jgi:sterol desaturase/sphingolipid hydroxylase (fatty acid hydroxylase superfamily)